MVNDEIHLIATIVGVISDEPRLGTEQIQGIVITNNHHTFFSL